MSTGKGNLIARVLQSVFYRQASGKAGSYVASSSRMLELLRQVALQIQKRGLSNGVSGVREQLLTLMRLVRSYATGEYRDVSMKSIVSVLAVLIYFVSPIDLIPDFLPVIGVTDDVALVLWLFRSINEEITLFADWEKKTKGIKIG
jgi:uncharacterized membrane protein YkvA (DUF1232 family)